MTAEDILTTKPVRGKPVTFDAHGKTFKVCRVNRTDYSLQSSAETRMRFGLWEEIVSDVRHAVEFGTLPARIDHAF